MLHTLKLNILIALIACIYVKDSMAQGLEPRLLKATPTGGNIAIASYGYSTGNILLDQTMPVEDLRANLNIFLAAYARSFKLLNRSAKFDVIIPYSFADFEGIVNNIDSSTSRSGFGDPFLRLSMILIGAKPLSISEFHGHEQKKFNLGSSIRIRPPLGQYDPTKLVNLGANRWTLNLWLAASYSIHKKLILEGHLNSWFFTENNEFFNGDTLKQKCQINVQIHVTYIFKPGVWIAVSTGGDGGGETVLNGIEQGNLQRNSRFGVAFAYRLNQHNALQFALSSGITTRYGANFTSISMAYLFIWFDKNKKSE
jgi:hypothetical protein